MHGFFEAGVSNFNSQLNCGYLTIELINSRIMLLSLLLLSVHLYSALSLQIPNPLHALCQYLLPSKQKTFKRPLKIQGGHHFTSLLVTN